MQENEAEQHRRQRYEALIGPLRIDLFRYAFWLGRDRGLAEDVVQEAMLRAWRCLDDLQDEGAAKQWLLTIVRREHARHFERKRLETADIDNLPPADRKSLADGHSADVEDVRRAIFRLDDSYREPLVLQVLMGFTTGEIAQLMNIEQGAVLTRLYRARKKLRSEFERKRGKHRAV
ncbi:MAG: sigma-70 family RNA polymerase sigma factor [Gammaproteobacteria bacterium]